MTFSSGWWFGTWLLFFYTLGMSSSQLKLRHIFQRGRAQPPSSHWNDHFNSHWMSFPWRKIAGWGSPRPTLRSARSLNPWWCKFGPGIEPKKRPFLSMFPRKSVDSQQLMVYLWKKSLGIWRKWIFFDSELADELSPFFSSNAVRQPQLQNQLMVETSHHASPKCFSHHFSTSSKNLSVDVFISFHIRCFPMNFASAIGAMPQLPQFFRIFGGFQTPKAVGPPKHAVPGPEVSRPPVPRGTSRQAGIQKCMH